MRPREVRRFTIADAMVLVSASAVSTLLLRSYMPGFALQLGYLGSSVSGPWGPWHVYAWLHGPGSCLVVPLTAAVIVARLGRPRPRWSRLACQPGFVACLAVTASLAPGLLWYATIRHRPGFRQPGAFEQTWSIVTHWTDTAVLGAWLALALARRCRAEASWVDRAGRALGVYWVLLLLALFALQWLPRILDLLTWGASP